MQPQAIPHADYLDIVFDNRNKAYGSYQLRKDYSKRTITAFSIVMGSILALSLYSTLRPHTGVQPQQQLNGIVELADITPPPIVIPKQEIIPPPAGPKVKTEKFVNPVIVDNSKVQPDETPVDKSKLTDAVASNTTSDGTTGGNTSITGNNNNSNTITPPVEPPAITAPITYAEVMPVFNGDLNAYLAKQLNYPDAARENNIEGRVVVQFIVSEDGSISGIKLLRGIGSGCDEEAIRVIKNMPRWKPGLQNGKAVKVFYTLPIRFLLN